MSKQKNEAAPIYEQLPTEIHVRIFRPSVKGPVLADASVNINGCFAVRGVQIRTGRDGPFVSMPSRLVNGEYRDVCFPCTAEFRRTFDQAVLNAYRMELRQADAQAQSGPVMGGLGE